MITSEELEMFIDDLIEPRCNNNDSCPINYGDNDDNQ